MLRVEIESFEAIRTVTGLLRPLPPLLPEGARQSARNPSLLPVRSRAFVASTTIGEAAMKVVAKIKTPLPLRS